MSFVERGGVRLHLEVHGPPEATPLLLLEGMGGDVRGWRRNLPRLSEAFRVIAFDFRGNGLSDRPDEPTRMEAHAQDAVALLDALGVARVHAYGLSFGGMVAQLLALEHADRLRGLVLAATHFGGPRVVPPPGRAPKGKPHLALYAPGFPEANPRHVAEDLLAGAMRRQPPHAARRQREAVDGFDVYERLPEISVPTLVLHGTEDQMVSVGNARILAERIPGAELRLLEGAGHVFHSERAEEADAIVTRFLRRVDRGG